MLAKAGMCSSPSTNAGDGSVGLAAQAASTTATTANVPA